MKTAFRISLLLNLGLVCVLGWLWFRGHQPVPAHPALTSGPVAVLPPPVSATVERLALSPPPAPFSWSRLLSPDYRTYVRNLRAFGCPEPTLRAIVTADVNARYVRQGYELVQKLDALNSGSWEENLRSYDQQQALKAQLLRLPDQEYAEICDFLGIQSSATVAAAAATTTTNKLGRVRHLAPRQPPVAPPLVLQDIDLAGLNFNEQQIQAVDGVRQDFLAQVGGATQVPDDPAAQSQWQQAQADADAKLEIVLGSLDFNRYRNLGYQASLAESYRQQNSN